MIRKMNGLVSFAIPPQHANRAKKAQQHRYERIDGPIHEFHVNSSLKAFSHES